MPAMKDYAYAPAPKCMEETQIPCLGTRFAQEPMAIFT